MEKKSGKAVWVCSLLFFWIAVLCVTGCTQEKADSVTIELRLEDRVLVRVTEPERVGEITALLSNAQALDYEPQTYILATELAYIGTDGETEIVELDLDGDLLRYAGKFYDYGPGNDNNAMPELLTLLGLNDWPQEVKMACRDWFASVEDSVPVNESYGPQAVYMDLWYPDWRYMKIQESHAVAIVEALKKETPEPAERDKVSVEDSVFTLHIAYDDGREYDLVLVGEEDFLLWKSGTEQVYSITSGALRKTVEDMIAMSKTQTD